MSAGPARAACLPRVVLPPVFGAALGVAFVLSLAAGEAAAGPAMPGIVATLWRWTPLMLEGFAVNLVVSMLSMALGTAAGVALGLGLVARRRLVRRPAYWVTQFFRNAPWLVLLFYCVLLLPFEIRVFGVAVPFPGWVKAVIGLALPVMANVAEIVRGGIQSIPLTQWQVAEALGLRRGHILLLVILPQCVKRMLPPWMNLYAILTMATPLISIVGVQEAMTLTRAALIADGRIELLVPMYLLLLSWFFIYCYPIALWTRRLERRYASA